MDLGRHVGGKEVTEETVERFVMEGKEVTEGNRERFGSVR
jgi:hypothetical protein